MMHRVINEAYGEKLRSSTQEGNVRVHHYKCENNASGRELQPIENEIIINLLRTNIHQIKDKEDNLKYGFNISISEALSKRVGMAFISQV
jgi:hypothetical protein